MKLHMPLSNSKLPKVGLLYLWLFLLGVGLTSSFTFLLTAFERTPQGSVLGLYASRSPEISQTTFETTAMDARAHKIEGLFDKFKCPLAGTGEFLVQQADQYQIPYWLVAAVSFQESGCGKKSPELDGVAETYNAWGYGVWGGRIKTFDNWEAGIAAVSKYFGINFFAKDITDPCEIMKTYTPPSKGSWCEGVKYFGKMIDSFESD